MSKNFVQRSEFEILQQRVVDIEQQISFPGINRPDNKKKGLSKREIFLQYNAESGPEKCLVVMSILDSEKGEAGFLLDDVRALYRVVKEKPPGNISDTIAKMEKRGLIQTLSGEGKRRLYSLTNTGENTLNNLKNDENYV